MQRTTKKWLIRIGICVVSVVATIAAVLAVQNLLPQEVLLDRDIRGASAVASAQFHYEVSNLPGPTVLDGNRITELQNGAESFPAMLAAIRAAKKSVDFETYVDWSGFISSAFANALSERARAGVPVHVLVDAIGGARMKGSTVNEMKGAGVDSISSIRCTGGRLTASTIATTARSWSLTGRSASQAASASPTNGRATRVGPTTGATCNSRSKAR